MSNIASEESPTTTEAKCNIKCNITTGLKKIENMHASVREYEEANRDIDIECEIGHFEQYYGMEYFAQHGLDAKSSPIQIMEWMQQNNIDFHPHFNDYIIGRDNHACSRTKEAPDETKLALHRQLFNEAKSKGHDFSFVVEITSDGYLCYMMYLIVKKIKKTLPESTSFSLI